MQVFKVHMEVNSSRGGTRVNCYGGEATVGVQGAEADTFLVLSWWSSSKACICLLKMTEKLILITLMHENTPHFLIFDFFFETMREGVFRA